MTDRLDRYGLLWLDDDQCWQFLAKHVLGRVAVIHRNTPLVFPVNYVLDEGSVVFRTAPGTKLAEAASGGIATFEVDEATALFETGASVMVHGTLHEVTDRLDQARLARLPLRTWAPGARDRFVRVRPKWVSGRRIPMHHHDDGVTTDGG